jgi:hypothetical protein
VGIEALIRPFSTEFSARDHERVATPSEIGALEPWSRTSDKSSAAGESRVYADGDQPTSSDLPTAGV